MSCIEGLISRKFYKVKPKPNEHTFRYPCGIGGCIRRFRQRSSLKYHRDTRHPEETRHKRPLGKTFKSRSTRAKASMSHIKEEGLLLNLQALDHHDDNCWQQNPLGAQPQSATTMHSEILSPLSDVRDVPSAMNLHDKTSKLEQVEAKEHPYPFGNSDEQPGDPLEALLDDFDFPIIEEDLKSASFPSASASKCENVLSTEPDFFNVLTKESEEDLAASGLQGFELKFDKSVFDS